MTTEDIVIAALEYAFNLALRVLGLDRTKQLTTERLEIMAARIAADAEAAAKFGQAPPP